MSDRDEIKRVIQETAEEEPAFDLLDFLNNARAFEEYVEQLEGAVSEDNRLFQATWSGLSAIIKILEEFVSDE